MLRPTIGKTVQFQASDGVHWTVREYAVDRTTAPIGEACLVFECDSVMRRVRRFPVDWRRLGAAALFELSWSA